MDGPLASGCFQHEVDQEPESQRAGEREREREKKREQKRERKHRMNVDEQNHNLSCLVIVLFFIVCHWSSQFLLIPFALSAAGLAAGVLLGGFAAVPDRAWPGIQARTPQCIGHFFSKILISSRKVRSKQA